MDTSMLNFAAGSVKEMNISVDGGQGVSPDAAAAGRVASMAVNPLEQLSANVSFGSVSNNKSNTL